MKRDSSSTTMPQHQDPLEAVGQAQRQRPIDAIAAMQQVREAEQHAEGQLPPDRAVVADPAVRARALDELLDVDQQLLQGPARRRPLAKMLGDQLALAVGQRDHAELDPVAIGDVAIEGVVACDLGDALLVRLLDVLGRPGSRSGTRSAGRGDAVAHIGQRQRQDLLAQRLVDRRQPVQLEQPDQKAHRGGVDQQGDQHEAGRHDRDEALDLGVDRAVLGDRQRQRQGHRAAHRAPQDHDLVAVADPLTEPDGAEHRQQAEQDQGPRGHRRERCDRDQQQIVELHADHQARHQHRGQDEHQRAGPERELGPDIVQELAALGRQPRAPQGADHEPRGDHRDHAGERR